MTPECSNRVDIAPLAERFGWRLVVLFGSAASRPAEARDVDMAVLPAGTSSLFDRGRRLAELERLFAPPPVDLLVLGPDTLPIARLEVFREGQCLYEAEPGLFSREQDRAFFLYADSEKFRRVAREVLHGRS